MTSIIELLATDSPRSSRSNINTNFENLNTDLGVAETKLAGIEAGADVTDAGNVGSAIHGASAKTAIVDADKLAIIDTQASNVLKTLSWAYVKSVLKTYFDSIYGGKFGVNIKDYGAVGDGETDDTEAIQTALDTGRKVLIPEGNFAITASLKPGGYDQVIEGEGFSVSIITVIGADVNGFDDSDLTYNRCTMRDFSIVGDNTTGIGIKFTKQCYDSRFENLKIFCGEQAIYMVENNSFSYSFSNCHFNSYNNHGIEIMGGNSVLFENCYVHEVGDGKVGYRIYAGATLISCNGLDSNADYWGMFGGDPGDGEPEAIYQVNLIGCNIEAFHKAGLRFKYNGEAKVESCVFIPINVAGQHYDTCIHTGYCDKQIILINNRFYTTDSTMDKLANVYRSAGAQIMVQGVAPTQVDAAGVLTNLPRIYSNGTTIVTV